MIPSTTYLSIHRNFAVKVIANHSIRLLHHKSFSTKTKSNSDILDLLHSMPKDRTMTELKQQRNRKKDFTSRYSASTIILQVLGNGSFGAPSSLYVFTDQARYLFNCGEGTQRLAHEHKMKLAKLEHIFLTSKSWSKVGGLPGVALTIQDIGVPSITLHGPPGLEKLFEATRRFVILNDLHIKVADLSDDVAYEDNVMNIDYVTLLPTREENPSSSGSDESIVEEDTTEYYGSVKGFKRHLEITHESSTVKKNKMDAHLSEAVLCYICRPKKKDGTLLIEKCVEKGVPPGPLLGRLKSGEDITLPNGSIVKANDVRSADCPGPVFIVVDCPSEEYIDSLIHNPKFNKHQKDAELETDSAFVVVHFTPSVVMKNPKYLQWMERFRITTTHLLLNDFSSGMGSLAVHRIQHKLNLLDSNLFPLLQEDKPRIIRSNVEPADEMNLNSDVLKAIPMPVVLGETLLKYHLRPGMGIDAASVVTLNPSEYVNETLEAEGFQCELEELHSKLAVLPRSEIPSDCKDGEYPKFLFLGTGSCIPNKTRNTSGILIQLSDNSSILLDCGEGTFGQIIRFFGKEKGQLLISQLKAVYVSHLHADHHLGLMNILQERFRAITKLGKSFSPVLLIAPQQIHPWLHLYHQQFEKIKPLYQLIPTGNILLNNNNLDTKYWLQNVLEPLDMLKVETIGVKHCPNAYGIAFTHKTGWKVTYSGDTMPSDNLVLLGENSDVLIHEATMEDDLKHEAVVKMHSTTSEAIEIGHRMKAKFILLTHFSQRYAKVPMISEHFGSNVGIAFDNMNVCLSDLTKIPLMYPALKCMFAHHYEEMESKTAKKIKYRDADLQ